MSEARAAVPLLHRPVTVHAWEDIVFAHWRHDPDVLGRMLPRGTRPDVVDGSAWVGLSAYVFRETRVPPFPPSGRLGSMTEVTIEVLTVDDHGRHGVAYRTVDTDNVPAIVAAHALLGVPYTFAHTGSRRRGDTVAHRSVRHPNRALHPFRAARALRLTPTGRPGGSPRPRHTAAVRVVAGPVTTAPLAVELTTRAGIHARHLAQTVFWQRQHPPLTIRSARVEQLSGDLPAAVGLPGLFDRAPDSALVVDATTVRYAWGDVVR
ncbi:YqjF family protein [Curtobacterium sp. NPDC089689]|uniref:YqjF family protein n=1 Tax=Curtobacterium sp. NPDC089689 TaxID=3363968 RepID=UPI00382FF951